MHNFFFNGGMPGGMPGGHRRPQRPNEKPEDKDVRLKNIYIRFRHPTERFSLPFTICVASLSLFLYLHTPSY